MLHVPSLGLWITPCGSLCIQIGSTNCFLEAAECLFFDLIFKMFTSKILVTFIMRSLNHLLHLKMCTVLLSICIPLLCVPEPAHDSIKSLCSLLNSVIMLALRCLFGITVIDVIVVQYSLFYFKGYHLYNSMIFASSQRDCVKLYFINEVPYIAARVGRSGS